MVDTSPITVETTVDAPIAKVWGYWTMPEHIIQWNNASDDWHTPKATNDLREGGKFTARMEAKDGSMGFDFGGTYTKVVKHKHIEYTMGDGRNVRITFEERDPSTDSQSSPQASSGQAHTHITETFDPESENSPDVQQQGWQSIMRNFKKYAESKEEKV